LNLVETIATGLALAIERTLLAKEMQDARVEAEAEQLRSALLSTVSHDLRTPLTSISGVASLLEQQPDMPAAKRKEMAQTIREESERLGRLVTNLLDMSRLEGDAVAVNPEWQSVEELVGSAINRVESLIEGRKLEVSIEPDLPLVKVDSVLLEQALVNLLENACRHTPKDSSVMVSSSRLSPTKLGITVSDEGPGIAPADEERIFDKFYRKATGSGSGLGLAITRGILKAHGGSIRASNLPGGGAVFSIELPVPATQPEMPRG
jgi:two-component system sensor histidine kinase KdpD